MSRSSRLKEKKYSNGNELSLASVTYEDSAARTRPFSFEEIMTRRKNKKVGPDAQDGVVDPDKVSRQDDKFFPDQPERDRGYRHNKESADVNAKKATEYTGKRSSKEEASTLKGRSSVREGDKESRPSETKLKVKLDYETVRDKERNNKKRSHYGGRNGEHSRDDNRISKGKESRSENQGHHRSRNEDRLRGDSEMDRSREHKNEKQSHHKSRHEKRPRDEESGKKHTEKLVRKETFLDSERIKSERENKRKHQNGEEGKDRLEKDLSAVKKHDSGKYNQEPAEKKSMKKDTSKSHYEGSGQKRRRSGSEEFKGKDRSISLSPRTNKRTYDVREQGESSLHSVKDRTHPSDVDKNRVSSNGAHTSSHSWRHDGRGNRLGGYSPRKRRSEAAIRTPSPTIRSPEKKNAGWDFTPTGTGSMPVGIIPDIQSLLQNVSTEHKLSSVVSVTPNAVGSLSGALPSSMSKANNAISDSIQLTEATRSARRLYIDNLPVSASDKTLMECLNTFLLSLGANHLHGTQPCISCSINKDKGQAIVEFLTAEDATTALSFDGKSFSGSVLRVKRPKDTATGAPEKSVPSVDAISDIVKDSPHKIFVGGISKALSSRMLMEIVSTFGHLKAYRFLVNDDFKEPCAFLEYVDQAITLKACAGLNGMKLGGHVLTVLQAVPDASVEGNTEKLPFYRIPEHAKPLLSNPTKVLKLKNVFNVEELSSLSASELEERLEDIRTECARFGTVKSINIVRIESGFPIIEETNEMTLQDLKDDTKETEPLEQVNDQIFGENNLTEASINSKDPLKDDRDIIDDRPSDDKLEEDLGNNETSELESSLITDIPTSNLNADAGLQEAPSELNTSKDGFTNEEGFSQSEDASMNGSVMVEEELKQEEVNDEPCLQLNEPVTMESETSKNDETKQEINDDDVFEDGCVLVEYIRAEACCLAAHCLHRRLYGDRIVLVNYFPHDLYLSRFPK